jgi:hypothetical protein
MTVRRGRELTRAIAVALEQYCCDCGFGETYARMRKSDQLVVLSIFDREISRKRLLLQTAVRELESREVRP